MAAQWWLAELDVHGNPKLVDGPHGTRAGADRAAYLYARFGFALGGRYAVARVDLSAANPKSTGVNEEALRALGR